MEIDDELSEESKIIAKLCFCILKNNKKIVNTIEINRIYIIFRSLLAKYFFELFLLSDEEQITYKRIMEFGKFPELYSLLKYYLKFSIY